MAVDPDKLKAFMGKAVGDIGAALSANMVLLGDKLGLYKAIVKTGSVTPAELAKATKTTERYVCEWLDNRAAGGYVTYDAGAGRCRLPEEQAMALADEGRPCDPNEYRIRSRPETKRGLRFVAPTGIVRGRITLSWEATWQIDWW
jgi:hypothetical protein